MIDTIVLAIPSSQFKITKPNAFTPFASIIAKADYPLSARQFPHKKDLLNGIYKPRLTLTNQFAKEKSGDLLLKIELSLPKLLYGNNFQELRYKDFAPLAEKLIALLKEMGISITLDDLACAPVWRIHYSKNIPLRDGSIPYHYLTAIKQATMSRALDTNQTDYRNDGHSFRWHCNAYEVIFYDKIKDLEQSKKGSKRTIENESDCQLPLFEKLKKRKKFEVLRMEVRLNKRAKIKSLFESLGIKSELTFKKLFKPAISKKVLLHYLEKLEHNRPPLLDYKPYQDKTLLADLLFNNPKLKPKQLMQLFGIKKTLEVMSARELQGLYPRYSGWGKMIKEASSINLPRASNSFSFLKKQIKEFKAIKI